MEGEAEPTNKAGNITKDIFLKRYSELIRTFQKMQGTVAQYTAKVRAVCLTKQHNSDAMMDDRTFLLQ